MQAQKRKRKDKTNGNANKKLRLTTGIEQYFIQPAPLHTRKEKREGVELDNPSKRQQKENTQTRTNMKCEEQLTLKTKLKKKIYALATKRGICKGKVKKQTISKSYKKNKGSMVKKRKICKTMFKRKNNLK